MAVVFNGTLRQIQVTDNTIFVLDAQLDIYSAWKDWVQLDTANAGYAPALRTFGGDPTVTGQFAPKYYFLINNWTVVINNGNIVSVGLNLYSDDFNSPYIVIAGSGVSDRNSDAVSINNSTIEFSSFNGGVTIDVGNITGRAAPGINFPIGTELKPSNNLTDAHAILVERGFNTFFVKGNLTISNEASWIDDTFIGESQLKSIITVLNDADIADSEFYDCTLTGVLDGDSQVERAVITNCLFLDGFAQNCEIGPGTVTLGTSVTASIFSSYSTKTGQTAPIIDLNGTGILGLRDYKGSVELQNYTGSGEHSIGLQEGNCILNTSIISGTFAVRGLGRLIDTSGNRIDSGTWNGGVTIINETVNKELWMTEVEGYARKASDNAEQANLKL